MRKPGPRYIWFKLSLVAGAFLGLLLLTQSIVIYYRVSRTLVTAELQSEARRQLTVLQREARQQDIQGPNGWSQVIGDMRQEEPKKIAWIKLFNQAGETLAQNGNPVGPPFDPVKVRQAFEQGSPMSEMRQTEAGKVLVAAFPLRLGRRPGPEGEAEERRRDRADASRGRQFFVEMALYWDSASGAFGLLKSDLIVSSSAALGLVLSMLLLWSRFPSYVQGKQLEQQTQMARQVQTDLLPRADSALENLDFAAECVPALQVGGDFYDVFPSDHGRIAILLGDVSGKGLPASVVVGLLLGAVRASNWLDGCTEHEASSRRLSELLRTRTSLDRFASMFWCYYEPQTNVLRYVNAGHLPPIVVKRNGGGGLEIQRLQEGGPVLGLVPAAQYRQGQAAISTGDLLVLYSDGVVEAANSSEEQFGEERLLAAIRDNSDRSSAEIRDEILGQVHSFLGQEQAQDDLTLVVARIQNGPDAAKSSG